MRRSQVAVALVGAAFLTLFIMAVLLAVGLGGCGTRACRDRVSVVAVASAVLASVAVVVSTRLLTQGRYKWVFAAAGVTVLGACALFVVGALRSASFPN